MNTVYTDTGQRVKKTLGKRIWEYRYFYLLLLPALIFYVLFAYVPMAGIQLAFKHFSILKGIWGSQWTGLENFKAVFSRADFWVAFKNTVIISALKLCFGFPIPILIAILFNELRSRKLRRTLQTIYTFPHFLSWVTLAGIIMNFLGDQGFVNNVLAALGMRRSEFMVNPQMFRGLLVFSDIWKESGWTCIMYLAAMAGIDPSLYESATIDGANRWNKIVAITWPGIRELAAILLILAVGNAMNVSFDQVFNLYSPPVYSSADIIDTYVYRITFKMTPDYGFSTAVGLFKGVINCALLMIANGIQKRLSDSSVF